jgi:hypothetical protein
LLLRTGRRAPPTWTGFSVPSSGAGVTPPSTHRSAPPFYALVVADADATLLDAIRSGDEVAFA